MESNFTIDLGSRVRHRIHGMEGIVTARIQYLTGCNQYNVASDHLDKEGKLIDGHYFDEDHLVVIGKLELSEPKNFGGPGEFLTPQCHR